jgi:predicted nucleotidyltransferase
MDQWGLQGSQIKKMVEVFARFPEIREARIFGSRAMGNYKPGSDVDIALFGNGPLACVTRVSAILNEELPLPYQFDIVDYAMIENPAFKAHIEKCGRQLYQS